MNRVKENALGEIEGGGRASGSGGLEECELNHHLEVLLMECTTPR